MNWSADEVALVPSGVVTVTSTLPAAPAGEAVVIWVSESTVKVTGEVIPNAMLVVLLNPVPVTVTGVPPATGPLTGEMPVIVGMAALATFIVKNNASRKIPVTIE